MSQSRHLTINSRSLCGKLHKHFVDLAYTHDKAIDTKNKIAFLLRALPDDAPLHATLAGILDDMACVVDGLESARES